MCYNYSLLLYNNKNIFEDVFGVKLGENIEYEDKYYVNAFDIPQMPVITNEDPEKIQLFFWGLIPFWVKKIDYAEKIRRQTMNARAETLFNKPSFRHSIMRKRCLIPANGFFEWRYVKGRNYPYYIYLRDFRFFAFAGIWDSWHDPETDNDIYTYSIITCEPNNLLRKIHNKKKRMPVILPYDRQFEWINNNIDDREIKKFLVSYPEKEMKAYTISRLVTSKNQKRNVPESIKPFIYEELKGFE